VSELKKSHFKRFAHERFKEKVGNQKYIKMYRVLFWTNFDQKILIDAVVALNMLKG